MFMFCESHFCATCLNCLSLSHPPHKQRVAGFIAGGDTKYLNYRLERFSSKRVNYLIGVSFALEQEKTAKPAGIARWNIFLYIIFSMPCFPKIF